MCKLEFKKKFIKILNKIKFIKQQPKSTFIYATQIILYKNYF